MEGYKEGMKGDRKGREGRKLTDKSQGRSGLDAWFGGLNISALH